MTEQEKPKKLTKGQLADIAKAEAVARAFARKQMSPDERLEELEAMVAKQQQQITDILIRLTPDEPEKPVKKAAPKKSEPEKPIKKVAPKKEPKK